MKKLRFFALLLCVILGLQSFSFPITAAELTTDPTAEATAEPTVPEMIDEDHASVTHGPHSPDGRYPVLGSDKLLKNAAAAVLYEVGSDTLVYAWNPDTPVAPSSLTKIMTALIAIEQGDLTASVTVSRRVLESVPREALIAGLRSEEIVTLEQLLYLMMVGSANDAAAIIADHLGEGQDRFVEMMNQRAAELGCTGTHFVNAHGLHDDAQVTTARDMVKILDKALEYPVFVELFGQTTYTLPATNKSEARKFYTSNYLASEDLTDDYYDSRVTGGRTGNTNEGHRNLAVTATEDGTTYLAVILASQSDYHANGVMIRQGAFEDAVLLFNKGFTECAAAQVLYADQVVAQIPVTNGTNDVVVGPQEQVLCVMPKNLDPALLATQVRLEKEIMEAPVAAGTLVGECQVFYDGICIASVALYTKNEAGLAPTQPQSPDQSQNPQDPGFDPSSLMTAFTVLGVIFAVILVLGGGLLLVRRMQNHAGKKRVQKRRQERRRSK